MKKDFCTMYLIRHGETEWNRDGKMMGQQDSPLTQKGVEQAEELAVELAQINFSAVYSSDLLRTFRTTDIVKGKRSLSLTPSVFLREQERGKFEGRPSKEFNAATEKLREATKGKTEQEQWFSRVEGCKESEGEVVVRFMDELKRISLKHPGEAVLVGTHGGPLRFFLQQMGIVPFGSLPPGFFKNAGYLIVKGDGSAFIVKKADGFETK